jgi:hypothetical protein
MVRGTESQRSANTNWCTTTPHNQSHDIQSNISLAILLILITLFRLRKRKRAKHQNEKQNQSPKKKQCTRK